MISDYIIIIGIVLFLAYTAYYIYKEENKMRSKKTVNSQETLIAGLVLLLLWLIGAVYSIITITNDKNKWFFGINILWIKIRPDITAHEIATITILIISIILFTIGGIILLKRKSKN